MADLQVVWERDLHQTANPRSIITPTVVIVPERHSKLCRVSPVDGNPMWIADVQDPWGWVAFSTSICAYLNQHSLLQCFDIESGSERWAVDLAGSHGSAFGHLTVVADRIIVGGWRGYSDIVALSTEDGAVMWTEAARGRHPMAPVRGPGETLLLPFPVEGRATLVEAATGDVRSVWGCPCPDHLPDGSPFVTAHVDRFVCLAPRGRIVALDPASDTDWVELARHKRPIRSFTPAITEALLVFEDVHGLLCAYSLGTMTQLWEAPVQHRRADMLPAAGLPSGALAFGDASGQLHVFGGEGQAVARVAFRKRFLADLSVTAAGAIVGANGGRLMALDAASL